MIAVGMAGAEADWHVKDFAQCHVGDVCMKVYTPVSAIVGTDAGVFSAGNGLLAAGGNLTLGSFCAIFVSYYSGAWHYASSACAQNPGYFPGPEDYVYVASGCANVRTAPGLSSAVAACLRSGTRVSVDSAPVYKDGYIWWHLAGQGWMANNFLIQPH